MGQRQLHVLAGPTVAPIACDLPNPRMASVSKDTLDVIQSSDGTTDCKHGRSSSSLSTQTSNGTRPVRPVKHIADTLSDERSATRGSDFMLEPPDADAVSAPPLA